jgi:hypothetical protein
MKRSKRALGLNRETVRSLSNVGLANVRGRGDADGDTKYCPEGYSKECYDVQSVRCTIEYGNCDPIIAKRTGYDSCGGEC